jgi:Yip1 domain
MSETAATPETLPDKGPAARFFGILFAPKATFQAVVAKPTWLIIALIVIILTGGAQLWFQSTTVGRQATLDESVRKMESYGFKVSDQVYEGMRKGIMEPAPWRTALSACMIVIVPPIIWAAIAGILYLVFAATGGQSTFKQVYAVVVHSSVPTVVGTLLITPVNYFRESLSSATNLGVFLPFLPEGSFLARLFGMVDVFWVWWLMVLAIGLAVCYRKKTRSVAVALFSVYGVIALAFAAIMAMRSSS